MELNLTVKGNSAPALAFIEYAKTLDFIEFEKPKKATLASYQMIDDDQEHYDFIMELSKKTNKKSSYALSKREKYSFTFSKEIKAICLMT